jgi:hypothetical protein
MLAVASAAAVSTSVRVVMESSLRVSGWGTASVSHQGKDSATSRDVASDCPATRPFFADRRASIGEDALMNSGEDSSHSNQARRTVLSDAVRSAACILIASSLQCTCNRHGARPSFACFVLVKIFTKSSKSFGFRDRLNSTRSR